MIPVDRPMEHERKSVRNILYVSRKKNHADIKLQLKFGISASMRLSCRFLCVGLVLTLSVVQSYVIFPLSSIYRPMIGNSGPIVRRTIKYTARIRIRTTSAVKAGSSIDLKPNAQIAEVLTAETLERRLKLLKDNENYDYESISSEFSKLKEANQIKLWDSVSPTFRRVSLGEVKMLTRGVIKEGTIDVTGEDDMQTLNFSFYSTLISSMTLSLLAGCFIPDIDLPFM
jgi:hypothetical protein